MAKARNSTRWTEEGYNLFAHEGPEGLHVEKIARKLQLNKSAFYHYFGNMQSYMEALVQYHISLARSIATEIAGARNIDPDLLQLIVKHKLFFLVDSQLLVKSRPALGSRSLDEAGEIINKEQLVLWRNTQGLPDDTAVALGLPEHYPTFYLCQDRCQ